MGERHLENSLVDAYANVNILTLKANVGKPQVAYRELHTVNTS